MNVKIETTRYTFPLLFTIQSVLSKCAYNSFFVLYLHACNCVLKLLKFNHLSDCFLSNYDLKLHSEKCNENKKSMYIYKVYFCFKFIYQTEK